MNVPRVPTSWGEVIDRITILEIKVARLPTEAARVNAINELNLLIKIAASAIARVEVANLMERLKALNEGLWDMKTASGSMNVPTGSMRHSSLWPGPSTAETTNAARSSANLTCCWALR